MIFRLILISGLFISGAGTLLTAPVIDPPLPPVLLNVSIDNDATAVILKWLPSPSAGIEGYVIYRFVNNEGYAIDTLWNPLATGYTDYNSGAFFASEAYVVAAIDTELNISPLSNHLQTIFLNCSLDTCNNRIMMVWNQYKPEATQVMYYHIVVSENFGNWVSIDSTGATKNHFEWKSFNLSGNYRIMVRAEMADNSVSLSNIVSVTTKLPKPPGWIEIANISISEENTVSVLVKYDPDTEINRFNIMRKKEGESTFTLLETIVSAGGALACTDRHASIVSKYIYRVDAVNNCGAAVISSSQAGNMVLALTTDNYILSFTWNPYTWWPGGLHSYSLGYENREGYIEIAAPDYADSVYSHDYSQLMYDLSTEKACFTITALRFSGSDNEYRSVSNRVCIETVESIFFPTAFTPNGDGKNDHFGPVIPFTPISFLMIVRNRMGHEVYRTNSHDIPWDGTIKGNSLPPDIYLWYVRIRTPSGKTIEKTGTVALIFN